MGKLFLIGLAGFVATLGRYRLSGVIAKRYGETFPLGTLVVNLLGCFLVGLLFYLLEERFLVNQTVRTVILIGFLGGSQHSLHSGCRRLHYCKTVRSDSPF